MRRRDVLLLRATGTPATFDLSCERLYMRYVDARRAPPALPALADPGLGEPDTVHDVPGTRDLVDGLARELASADVVRVIGREWLADDSLNRDVDRLLTAFAARGGRVEWK